MVYNINNGKLLAITNTIIATEQGNGYLESVSSMDNMLAFLARDTEFERQW